MRGKGSVFLSILISPPPLPAQIPFVNQVMFALFLSGSKQNPVLLEMEERKKGILKAGVG